MSDAGNIKNKRAGSGHMNISEEQLMAYVDGKLPADESRLLELTLSEDNMESDALEGLQALGAPTARASVGSLKHKLRNAAKQKKRKRADKLNTTQITLVAVAVILLLAVIAYLVLIKTK